MYRHPVHMHVYNIYLYIHTQCIIKLQYNVLMLNYTHLRFHISTIRNYSANIYNTRLAHWQIILSERVTEEKHIDTEDAFNKEKQ